MKKAINIIFWVIFLLSFVPYLYLVKAAIFGADVGLFYPNWAYGFEAVYVLIYFFSIVPVFPVCLIFEIIYVIIMFRKMGKNKRLITVLMPVSIIILIVVPCIFHEINDKYLDKKYYEKNNEIVWEYLRDNYSDEILENSQLTLKDRKTGCYWLRLDKPLFGEIVYIDIRINEDGSITDDFVEKFNNTNNREFLVEFGSYLDSYFGMDESTDLQPMVNDIDLSSYSFDDGMDSVFEKCDYVITSVYFKQKTYDKEVTIEKIKDFYKEIMPLVSVQDNQSFNFYVMEGDRFYAAVHVYDKEPLDDELTLFFSGYCYTTEEGKTIQDETVNIVL